MKLNDPALWPATCGPLRFERLDDGPSGEDAFALTSRGLEIAELTRRDDPDREVHLPVGAISAGCWELDVLLYEAHVIDTYVLWRAPSCDHPPALTAEVAAWAQLTVFWAVTSTAPGRG